MHLMTWRAMTGRPCHLGHPHLRHQLLQLRRTGGSLRTSTPAEIGARLTFRVNARTDARRRRVIENELSKLGRSMTYHQVNARTDARRRQRRSRLNASRVMVLNNRRARCADTADPMFVERILGCVSMRWMTSVRGSSTLSSRILAGSVHVMSVD